MTAPLLILLMVTVAAAVVATLLCGWIAATLVGRADAPPVTVFPASFAVAVVLACLLIARGLS